MLYTFQSDKLTESRQQSLAELKQEIAERLKAEKQAAANLRQLRKKETAEATAEYAKQADAVRSKAAAIVETYDSMQKSISQILQKSAADSQTMAAFEKTMALFGIAIRSAQAIANAVASAKGATAFDYVAQVVTAITAVTTAMGQAQNLLQAQQPAIPRFARGGLVEQAGTYAADTVPAYLSPGESVINRNSTALFAPLLSALNTMGGGASIAAAQTSAQAQGTEMLSDAFARALEKMPPPVVSVTEISRLQNRVKVLENLSKI
jgi:molecular chaperone GrpE (heat shock protein)